MARLIAETRPKARKEHRCMAYDLILNCGIDDIGLNKIELQDVAEMEANKGMIQKGEVYVRQFSVEDGEGYTWTASIKMIDICIMHELFEEY